ncbi:MAG: hypothetical protein OXH05_12960 [Acidobacteria bacterium]|nr:hypothetical protein [Acidobacteriota bacterium]
MSTLNLLDYPEEDPPAGPDAESPDPETPPGLDAIRAWLRKPRPWLRGVRLWIAWIRREAPKTWQRLRKHGRRIAKWLRRLAAEGTVTRRVLERVGHLLRETAVKLDAAFKAFRDPRGESQGATGELDQLGETFRRLGERVTLGARLVGIVVSALKRLADFFPEPPAATPVPGSPETHRPPPDAPGTDPPTPDAPGTDPPTPDASATDPPTPDTPGTDPPAPDAPETDPPAPDTRETDPPASAATPRPVDWEARLKGLPPVLHQWVRELGPQPRRDTLHALILKICSLREWTTSEDLARFLDMHKASLVYRHLRPLVDAGLLELKHPDQPNHPRQAYRTRPEAAAPHM